MSHPLERIFGEGGSFDESPSRSLWKREDRRLRVIFSNDLVCYVRSTIQLDFNA